MAARSIASLWALLALCGVAIMPATAGAAITYEQASWECGGSRGSGEADAAGNLYVTCERGAGMAGPHVRVYDATGAARSTVPLPGYATDVAPSPDGSLLYVMERGTNRVVRYARTAAGGYARDAGWRLAWYPLWGGWYEPLGEFLTTDDHGNLYVTSGTWTSAPSTVVKYRPDGSYVTQFGTWQQSWQLGSFYWLVTGLAVTPDGGSVYVAEVGNNRVQRFDRLGDGSYAAVRVVVGNDPARDADPYTGWCGAEVRAGRLAAPYDVGLDGAGNLYVANTTCGQVQVFDPSGAMVASELVGGLNHGIAVDRHGRVYVPQTGRALYPAGTRPAPAPGLRPIAADYRGFAVVRPRDGSAWAAAWKWAPAGWTGGWWPAGRRAWVQPWVDGWMWAWYDGAWHAARATNFAA